MNVPTPNYNRLTSLGLHNKNNGVHMLQLNKLTTLHAMYLRNNTGGKEQSSICQSLEINISRLDQRNPLAGLTPPHLCAWNKPVPRFLSVSVFKIFMFVRGIVVSYFADHFFLFFILGMFCNTELIAHLHHPARY